MTCTVGPKDPQGVYNISFLPKLGTVGQGGVPHYKTAHFHRGRKGSD